MEKVRKVPRGRVWWKSKVQPGTERTAKRLEAGVKWNEAAPGAKVRYPRRVAPVETTAFGRSSTFLPREISRPPRKRTRKETVMDRSKRARSWKQRKQPRPMPTPVDASNGVVVAKDERMRR